VLTVRIVYLDGTEDVKECLDVSDLVLDGVDYIKIIRNEKVA
jgi:hypothetical protein